MVWIVELATKPVNALLRWMIISTFRAMIFRRENLVRYLISTPCWSLANKNNSFPSRQTSRLWFFVKHLTLLLNPLLFTYRSTQLKIFLSWGKFSHTWKFTKTALNNCCFQENDGVHMDPVNNMGKKIHQYFFAGIKSWRNKMTFKCKVFWINSKLSEAMKVNLIILTLFRME